MEIKLRNWELSDAEDLSSCGNDYEVSKYLRDIFPYPYTIEDANTYIEFVMNANGNEKFYAVQYEGRVIGAGNIGFRSDVNKRSAGIGYWIGKDYWGMGIGTLIVEKLCEVAFDNNEIVRVDAEIISENIGSRRVLEKNGFVTEGTLRKSIYKYNKFYDAVIFSKIR